MSELRRALTLAQMGLEQGMSIDGHIAANGPTLREVIARALARPDAAPAEAAQGEGRRIAEDREREGCGK